MAGLCETGCGKPAVDRHHIDGDTSNNARSNILLVCRRCHMHLDGRAFTGHENHPRGEAHPGARLTEADVREIRRRRSDGEPLSRLSLEFGMAQTTISAIAHRKLWQHIY
jgi:hypothetical protein